jgi:hypothetical protein
MIAGMTIDVVSSRAPPMRLVFASSDLPGMGPPVLHVTANHDCQSLHDLSFSFCLIPDRRLSDLPQVSNDQILSGSRSYTG